MKIKVTYWFLGFDLQWFHLDWWMSSIWWVFQLRNGIWFRSPFGIFFWFFNSIRIQTLCQKLFNRNYCEKVITSFWTRAEGRTCIVYSTNYTYSASILIILNFMNRIVQDRNDTKYVPTMCKMSRFSMYLFLVHILKTKTKFHGRLYLMHCINLQIIDVFITAVRTIKLTATDRCCIV